MGKGVFFMKKNKRTYYVAIASILALMIFAFMGLEKFNPEIRQINIIDNNAITTSNKMMINDKDLDIKAGAAILIDGEGNNILYSKNEKKHLPPASVTKVMTILLILEACEEKRISLNDKVTISENSAKMGGSQMYMEAGEEHTVEELIKGIIMVSANDA